MSNANEFAISVRGVSKSYTIMHDQEKHSTLAEAMLARLKDPFRRQTKETFWALKDIEFDLNVGDVMGIIGRNGAGKSTLLKILSRITEPTTGEINLYGRIGSLLEVGTGFHPELTGRENIFLNGAIIGMRRGEIQRQFDAIVEFAGVSQFLDTPVKRYSSGMYVRLAFAVAAHLASEILVIDEVLAVGDVEFQKKCLGKMKDVAQSGRTVLFVSHQMQAINTLCNKAMYIEDGRVNYIGDVSQAINRYLSSRQTPDTAKTSIRRPGSGEMRFTSMVSEKSVYMSTDPITIEMEVTAFADWRQNYWISLEIANGMGIHVLHLDSRLLNVEFTPSPRRTIRYTIRDARLAQGEYSISAYLCGQSTVMDRFEEAMRISIAPLLPYPSSRTNCAYRAMMYPKFSVDDTTDSATLPKAETQDQPLEMRLGA